MPDRRYMLLSCGMSINHYSIAPRRGVWSCPIPPTRREWRPRRASADRRGGGKVHTKFLTDNLVDGLHQRTTFVRRETWFPGSSTEINGRPMAIHSADGLFQAVTVPAGSHHIAFSYVPAGMNWALLGWLAGGALMLVPTARSASSFRVRT
jgi:hypothetical protein